MEEILGFKLSALEDFKKDIKDISDKFKILASDTDGLSRAIGDFGTSLNIAMSMFNFGGERVGKTFDNLSNLVNEASQGKKAVVSLEQNLPEDMNDAAKAEMIQFFDDLSMYVSRQTTVPKNDIFESVGKFLEAGVTLEQLQAGGIGNENMLMPMAQFAQLNGIQIQDSAFGAGKAINGFQLDDSQFYEGFDLINKYIKVSKMDANKLIERIKTDSGAAMSAWEGRDGLAVEEDVLKLSAVLDKLSTVGSQNPGVMQSEFLQALTIPIEKMTAEQMEAFKTMGILSQESDANGNVTLKSKLIDENGMLKSIDQIEAVLEESAIRLGGVDNFSPVAQSAFGASGGLAAKALATNVTNGLPNASEIGIQAVNVRTMNELAGIEMDTFTAKAVQLSNEFSNLDAARGGSLIGIATSAVEMLNGFIAALTDFFTNNQWASKLISGVSILLAGLVGLVTTVGSISFAWGALKGILGGAAVGVTATGVGATVGKGVASAGVIGGVAGVQGVFGPIVGWLSSTFGPILAGLSSILAAIAPFILPALIIGIIVAAVVAGLDYLFPDFHLDPVVHVDDPKKDSRVEFSYWYTDPTAPKKVTNVGPNGMNYQEYMDQNNEQIRLLSIRKQVLKNTTNTVFSTLGMEEPFVTKDPVTVATESVQNMLQQKKIFAQAQMGLELVIGKPNPPEIKTPVIVATETVQAMMQQQKMAAQAQMTLELVLGKQKPSEIKNPVNIAAQTIQNIMQQALTQKKLAAQAKVALELVFGMPRKIAAEKMQKEALKMIQNVLPQISIAIEPEVIVKPLLPANQQLLNLGLALPNLIAAGINSEKGQKFMQNAVDGVKTAIEGGLTTAEEMRQYGSNLIQAWIDGMNSKTNLLRQALDAIALLTFNYVGVQSPTKEGPLHTNQLWGGNLIKSFAGGMDSESYRLMESVNQVSASLLPIAQGSGEKPYFPIGIQYMNNSSESIFGEAYRLRPFLENKNPMPEFSAGRTQIVNNSSVSINISGRDKSDTELARSVAKELEKLEKRKLTPNPSLCMSPYGYRMGY